MSFDTFETGPAALSGEPVPPSLKRFIWDIQSMVELADSERKILVIGRDLMARLIATDDWLPAAFARPDPTRSQRFQLYADVLERFSIVATVLEGGQTLPIVQEPVWQIAGVLRGTLSLKRFGVAENGRLEHRGAGDALPPGQIATFPSNSPGAAQFGNHLNDDVSIVIQVHGGEMSKLPHQTFARDGGKHEAVVT